jgi:hypothetical protein
MITNNLSISHIAAIIKSKGFIITNDVPRRIINNGVEFTYIAKQRDYDGVIIGRTRTLQKKCQTIDQALKAIQENIDFANSINVLQVPNILTRLRNG